MTSFNHYALGAVAEGLHSTMVGIQRTGVAYNTVRIAPLPGGEVTSARGAHETPRGRIEVSWRIEGDEFALDITIPEGVSATVVLPRHPDAVVHEVSGGRHEWRYAMAPEPAPGYTLATPMKVLVKDKKVWPALVETVSRHRGDDAPFTKFDDILVKSSPSNYLNQWVPTPEFEAALRQAIGAEG